MDKASGVSLCDEVAGWSRVQWFVGRRSSSADEERNARHCDGIGLRRARLPQPVRRRRHWPHRSGLDISRPWPWRWSQSHCTGQRRGRVLMHASVTRSVERLACQDYDWDILPLVAGQLADLPTRQVKEVILLMSWVAHFLRQICWWPISNYMYINIMCFMHTTWNCQWKLASVIWVCQLSHRQVDFLYRRVGALASWPQTLPTTLAPCHSYLNLQLTLCWE